MKPNGCKCDGKSIVIAARPGIYRNSLCSYLRAIPGVHNVLLAEDATVLQMVREGKPRAVILDSDLAEVKVLDLIHVERPDTRILVLSDSIRQQRLYSAAGASHALLKGFLDEHLRDAVIR